MPHDNSKIYYLSGTRRQVPLEEAIGEAIGNDGDGLPRGDDITAMIKCLDYLYAETKRLNAHTAAHLIGAASVSLRQDLAEQHAAEE